MLVDLEWIAPKHKPFKEFDTSNGGLKITFDYSGKEYVNRVASRICRGVYWTIDLWNNVDSYSNWEVEHPYDAPRSLYTEIEEALKIGDTVKADAARTKLMRMKNEFGNADNLKQIFKYGNPFIKSKEPYVLGVYVKTLTDSDVERYLHKNGTYIGNTKRIYDLEEVLHFHFCKLKEK